MEGVAFSHSVHSLFITDSQALQFGFDVLGHLYIHILSLLNLLLPHLEHSDSRFAPHVKSVRIWQPLHMIYKLLGLSGQFGAISLHPKENFKIVKSYGTVNRLVLALQIQICLLFLFHARIHCLVRLRLFGVILSRITHLMLDFGDR